MVVILNILDYFDQEVMGKPIKFNGYKYLDYSKNRQALSKKIL